MNNFERMIALATKVFDAKNDPDQLDVNEEVLERLRLINQDSISEYDDGQGPVAWLIGIPTTTDLMTKFLEHQISESQLFVLTPLNVSYDAIYLCSALVLPEYRNKGIAKNLSLTAIDKIRKKHPIKSLFVWAFSDEGRNLASSLAHATGLELGIR